MSTIGYGDISPGTIPERIMGMFLMSAGRAQQCNSKVSNDWEYRAFCVKLHPDESCGLLSVCCRLRIFRVDYRQDHAAVDGQVRRRDEVRRGYRGTGLFHGLAGSAQGPSRKNPRLLQSQVRTMHTISTFHFFARQISLRIRRCISRCMQVCAQARRMHMRKHA